MHNNAELKLIMQTKNYYANTQSITQECSRISGEGLSWLNKSVSKQTTQAHISIEAQENIKHVKYTNNNSMQDINTSEREISNHKHERIILRFEHTCSTSPPLTL